MQNLIEQIEIFPNVKTSFITLDSHEDFRGEFYDVWRSGHDKPNTEQVNVSISRKGVLRGLHFQAFYQQAKFLTVLNGSIIDILVNIDYKSKDYFGTFNFVHLNKGEQLLVPKKMAHGFLALQDNTAVMYQCDTQRVPDDEVSIDAFDESILHMDDYRINLREFVYECCADNDIQSPIVSEKDYGAISLWEFNKDRFPL